MFFPPSILPRDLIVPEVDSPEALIIGGDSPSDPVFEDADVKGFTGLIADVRLWSTPLGARQIQDRASKELKGNEPGLLGDWPLNQAEPKDFKDLCHHDRKVDSATGVSLKPTNLSLDNSLFPYLLDSVTAEWPNKERWIARGEDAPRGRPAACGEVLAFTTDQWLYAIDAVHGTRRWARELASPSEPASDRKTFYVTSGTKVVAVDAETGGSPWQAIDLSEQKPASDVPAASGPLLAVSNRCVVVSVDRKTVYWLDKGTGEVLGTYSATSAIRGELAARHDSVYLAADKLYRFADASPSVVAASAPVELQAGSEPRMCVERGRLFLWSGAWIESLDAGTLKVPQVETASGSKSQAWAPPSVPAGEAVVGLAASAAGNRLVATTDQGRVLFLDYGSGAQVSTATLPGLTIPYAFAPVIEGQTAYVTGKGTGGQIPGGVYVYDLAHGMLRARAEVDSPPVSAAYAGCGAAYFGCDDGGHSDAEAMHSVVFGQNLALYRKGSEEALTVPGVAGKFAGASASPAANAFATGTFSLELWMNAAPAGDYELLSLPPWTHSGHDYGGFRLAVSGGGLVADFLAAGSARRFTSIDTGLTDRALAPRGGGIPNRRRRSTTLPPLRRRSEARQHQLRGLARRTRAGARAGDHRRRQW